MAATPLMMRDDPRMSSTGSDDAGELMTSAQVMTYMGWSRMTLERRMKAGRLIPVNRSPKLDRPKVLLFRRADVERLARGESAN